MEIPESTLEKDWFILTDREYYHRVRFIMLNHGMGEGDVEMILANLWEAGWKAGYNRAVQETT